ncbi:hypothetical protein [Bradyrhizobium sp.]
MALGLEALQERDKRFEILGIRSAGDNAPACGTRASANTSGPNLNWRRVPVKLRTFGSAPMKKTSFFCRTGFREERALSKSAVRPFDLMSRRHPLSSTRAAGLKFTSLKANRPDGSCDVAGINLPAIF